MRHNFIILLAFIVFASSTELLDFNIITGNSTYISCLGVTENGTIKNFLRNDSVITSTCLWVAVKTSTGNGFQLINRNTRSVASIQNIDEWMTIGNKNCIFPPPAYTPISIAINAGIFTSATSVWNVEGNQQNGSTISLYGQ